MWHPACAYCADSDSLCVVIDTSDVSCARREFVESLRREEFGVNVALSDDGQRLMTKQTERLGRSLERLSKDLYSKDTHFVLELVQNADDNSYPLHMFEYVYSSAYVSSSSSSSSSSWSRYDILRETSKAFSSFKKELKSFLFVSHFGRDSVNIDYVKRCRNSLYHIISL